MAPILPHAQLEHSTPAAKARLTRPPKEIELTFTEVVRVPMTLIVLKDSAGRVAPTGATERDSSGRSVRVAVRGVLKPGPYVVAWKNQALNGHPESGSFGFRVLRPGEQK